MNFSGPTLGYIMGTVFTVVLQVQCWWVQVQCLTSNTTAYTAPITAMSQTHSFFAVAMTTVPSVMTEWYVWVGSGVMK